MKLFRLLSTTAVTVLAIAALAISASAMSATYDATTGKATISGITLNADAEQKTLLILNEDATTVEEGHIVQIDQAADFTTVTVGNLSADIDAANTQLVADYTAAGETVEAYETLDAAWIDNDEYYIRVGGNGVVDETTKVAYDAYTLVVDTTVTKPTKPEEPEEPVSQYGKGDIDRDGDVTGLDATAALQTEAWMYFPDTEQEWLGDADGDTWVTGLDATEMLKFEAWMSSTLNQYYGRDW